MKILSYISALLCAYMLPFCANAQLAANPWVVTPPSPNSGDFSQQGGVQYNSGGDNVVAPMYELNDGKIIAVDPWARARDKTNVRTWRGSGQHGKLNYIGEATTFTDAQGQEMIAPEVNRHNMLVVLEHLRNLGYKIPDSYDQKIRDLPKDYSMKLRENYDYVTTDATDPFSKILTEMMEKIEEGTGLDFQNILFNSVDLIGTD